MAMRSQSSGMVKVMAIGLATAVFAGCHGGGECRPRPGRAIEPLPCAPYSAYRPACSPPGPGSLFLNGYAGYNYGPGPLARRRAYCPSPAF
jgi:hypothetical protein